MSGEQRLARTLLSLAGLSEDGFVRQPVAKIPQDVLAAKVGTTRSRINQFMTKFRKLGLIDYDASATGKIDVHGQLMSIVDAE